MSGLPMLPTDHFERIRRYFPYPHGVARVDDLRVISGIIYVTRFSTSPDFYIEVVSQKLAVDSG